jgi:hypothetical protein
MFGKNAAYFSFLDLNFYSANRIAKHEYLSAASRATRS